MIFIYDVKTYRKVNNKGQEMCDFAQAYDRILVQDKCAMDSLKCEFEEVVKNLMRNTLTRRLSFLGVAMKLPPEDNGA